MFLHKHVKLHRFNKTKEGKGMSQGSCENLLIHGKI